MEEPRNGFVFYHSWWIAIVNLPREVQMDAIKAIMEYGFYGQTPEQLKPIAIAMLTMAKPQIDANYKRFKNGSKGGCPKGKVNNPNGRRGKETDQEITENKPKLTKNKPTSKQEITKNKPKEKDKYKDSEDKSSSSPLIPQRGKSDDEDDLQKQIEVYKHHKPIWHSDLEKKFHCSAEQLDDYLDEFCLDMRCKEIAVYSIPALFVSWLNNKLLYEAKSNPKSGRGAGGYNASKLPSEPDYGLIE